MSTPTGILVRLTAAEADLLAEHLLRLDPQDRRLRFMGSVAEDTIRRHCDSLDWAQACVLGVFVDGTLRAVAELVPHDEPDRRAFELAVTVERAFQDHGLGTRLLRAVLTMARNRFAESITLTCLPENRRMQHIAKKFGARLAFRHGEVEGRIRHPWPTCFTLADEAAMQGQSFMRALLTQPQSEQRVE